MPGAKAEPDQNDATDLQDAASPKKGLSGRQIEFIAIGGAVGAGLFLGSGQGIRLGGPSVLLALCLVGAVVYLMTRALGELTLNLPNVPSFIPHIEIYVGDWAGFATGWSYWIMWVIVGIGEITAVALLLKFWFPGFPQWLAAALTIGSLWLLNRVSVRLFGEIELWLTLVKVATIIGMIAGGIAMIIFRLGPRGHEADLSNLWSHGGFFPNGLRGFTDCLVIALFNFGGVELIGLTASEATNPHHTVPRAIRGVILRILIFYVGSQAVMMAVAPWNSFRTDRSPYVMVFEFIGLPGAASLINFVVITAVISSCNSGIFATGRLLYSLAQQGDAPAFFRVLNDRNLSGRAISASSAAVALGVLLNYFAPEKAFGYLLSIIAALLIWTWIMIVLAHLGFRRAQTDEEAGRNTFKMPLYPATDWAVLAGFGLVLVLMAFDPASRPTLYMATTWFSAIITIYFLTAKTRAASKATPMNDERRPAKADPTSR